MFVFISIVLVFFSRLSQSGPVSNSPQYISWESEPTKRGTWSLITSCLITLTLCVYTAIHLNVPTRKTTKFQKSLQRARWVMIGLLAPELVVYTAWWQWASARQMTREMKKIQKLTTIRGKTSSDWAMTHSFFAEMGGFVIEFQNHPLTFPSSEEPQRMTLTAEGCLQLAQQGYELPEITAESIKDRSKADTVAKALACLQAAYIIIQILGRLVDGLTVTLLEVNTVGHVICALVMFAFWLQKPLNVEEPVIVKNKMTDAIGALQGMKKVLNYDKVPETDAFYSFLSRLQAVEDRSLDGEREIRPYMGIKRDFADNRSQIDLHNIQAFHRVNSDSIPSPLERQNTTLDHVEFFNRPPESEDVHLWLETDVVVVVEMVAPQILEQDFKAKFQGLALWSRSATKVYWFKYPVDSSRTTKELLSELEAEPHTCVVVIREISLESWNQGWEIKFLEDPRETRVAARSSNWPESTEARNLQLKKEWVVISTIGSVTGVYGGIHALQWHAHFPTHVEQILWRISSLIIASSGFFVVLVVLTDEFYVLDHIKKITSSIGRWVELWRFQVFHRGWGTGERKDILSPVGKVLKWGGYFMLSLLSLCYIAARIFIVIEAFISLRSLPADAYQTPNWTQLIFHL